MSLSDESPLKDVPVEFAKLDHPVWDEISPEFLPSEFEEPEAMDVGFLRLLFKARVLADVPFRVLDTVRNDSRSAHGERPCSAIDVQLLNSRERSRITRAAYAVGFVRVGVYQGTNGIYRGERKKDGGGLHIDGSRTKPSGYTWTMKLP